MKKEITQIIAATMYIVNDIRMESIALKRRISPLTVDDFLWALRTLRTNNDNW